MHSRSCADASVRREGNLLIMVILFLAFAASAVLTTMSVVNDRTRDAYLAMMEFQAREMAKGGVYQGMATLKLARDMGTVALPFSAIDNLDTVAQEGPGYFTRIVDGRYILDHRNAVVGQVDVFLDVTGRGNAGYRDVTVSAVAYIPGKAEYASGRREATRYDAHCTVRVQMTNSQVFDYSYFINHWGWFFGDNIISNGTIRSNGQFDGGGRASTVNGSPRYESTQGTDLIGYMDDNDDGLTDGSDGGIFTAFGIVNASRIRGMGGLAKNQHTGETPIKMPNLNDLTWYEGQAVSRGASIQVDGVTYVNGVLGDEAGEEQHLCLVGTADKPIVVNGPVVVRGSVIISGYVTGKGTIYSGGNVYVAGDLKLKNPPATWRPAANDEATTEAWLQAGLDKDALGLFARQHVVLGDYTDGSWQSSVSTWLSSANNKSKEDAGLDGIQNTRSGPDGVLGTADDDVLEGDGQWTVSRYTQADADAGLLPAGKSVGDVIPGSGEDIDGDGRFTDTTKISDFNLPAALTTTDWKSNILDGTPKSYNQIATVNINEIDAVFYTNHAFAGKISGGGGDILFNGAVVSRNEAIIYSARNLYFNHDERLTGRGGDYFGFYVPKSWDALVERQWEFNRGFPLAASDLMDPAKIARFFVGASN